MSPDHHVSEGAWVVLDDLRSLGGFTALVAPVPESSDAVPWGQVLSPEPLAARFAAVRAALADSSGMRPPQVDPRVAVSATQVGLASRLWSPVLSGAVLHGWVPDLSPANLLASPVHRGQVPLGLADPLAGAAVRTTEEAAEVIGETVVRGSLRDLDEACATVGRTAPRVLLSNAASALTGAARVLAGQRPAVADAASALVRALLADPDLAPGGAFQDNPDGTDGSFLRGGCCLFYRLPGHGLCPDCVLAPRHPDQVTDDH